MNPLPPPLVMWVVEMKQDRHDASYSQGFENGFTTPAAEGILLGFGQRSRDFLGDDLVENVINQRTHVSAFVRSTSNASRLERPEIDVVRSHSSDKIMTTTRAQQKQGFVPKVSLSDGVRGTIAWHTERGEL